MRNILITGGAGFIGSNLSEKLMKSRRYKVYILDIKRNTINLKDFHYNINYIQGDVRNEMLLKILFDDILFDGVIHLAAVSRVVECEKNPDICIATNIGGAKSLLNSISKLHVKPWLIFGSSREVYGEQQIFPVKENSKKMPINIYGRTKLKGEKLIEKYSKRFGIDSIILRFSNVYGNERDILDRVIPKFVIRAIKGEPLEIQGGTQIFDFTHIEDTVRGIIAAIKFLEKNNGISEDVHILTGKPTKIIDLPDIISKYVKTEVSVKFTDPRSYDVERFYGDPSKAKDLLGFESKIDINTGVKMTVERFLEVFR